MNVKKLLSARGRYIVSLERGNSVEDAIRFMHSKKISSILITEDGKPVGIFTERDVVNCHISAEGKSFKEISLSDVMTTNLIVARPEDDLDDVMSVMVQKDIRHLPVIDKGEVIGMLSTRDVIQAQVTELTTEMRYLKDYITGF